MNQKPNYICPLCDGPNECAMAQPGGIGTDCWCRDVAINSNVISMADRTRNFNSCICKQCATATTANYQTEHVEARLYCAPHCHICEEAKSIISRNGVVAHNINIIENDHLFQKYRLRIPVLQRVDNNEELNWPFDSMSLLRFLK